MTLYDFNAQFAADQRARRRVERILSQYDHLPTADGPSFEPDGARITVSHREHLAAWRETVGGPVTATGVPGGFEVWMLTGRVEDWRGGPPIVVRVALLVVAGEWDLDAWLQCVNADGAVAA